MLRITAKFILLGILIGVVISFYRDPKASQTKLQIVVAEQPEAPIRLFPTFLDQANPLRPRFGFSINNATDKPICAYTVRENATLSSGAVVSSTVFAHLVTTSQFLRPHGSIQEEGNSGITYREVPATIELSVDFVEFVDGTRWGEDGSSSGQRLDGKRAGAKAATELYTNILAKKGVAGLRQALGSPDAVKPDKPAPSDRWQQGFDSGVALVKSRLEHVKDGTEQDLKNELAKPVEAVDRRPNQ